MAHAKTDPPTVLAQPDAPPAGPIGVVRMAGSSIASRDAAPWITDFLNAAYFRRRLDDRDVDDLRLAFAVLTTYWYRARPRGRLRFAELKAFHRAFGADRFGGATSGRGVLSREQLLDGANALLGGWFAEAYADDRRRGWGIAFKTAAHRAAYEPARRRGLARLGPLTPECAPLHEQTWHTYPPVRMPSVEGVLDALTATETWPDYASEIGRFTPLRAGGLAGQTFEIEVAAGVARGRPVFTRGYVTVTRLVTPADPAELRAYFAELEDGMARYGDDEPAVLPVGAEPVAALDLTTHEGHFMGRGHNRLLLYAHDGGAYVRAAGTWDPLRWHLDRAYAIAGRDAQHAFWGQGGVASLSMLHQLAAGIERRSVSPT